MAISLNDFRAVSNGEYNAGQIDFTTNRNGEVTASRPSPPRNANKL